RELVGGNTEVFWGDGVFVDITIAQFPHLGGSVDGDFIGAGAMHDDGATTTQLLKDLRDGASHLRVRDAHNLKFWARRRQDRTQRVEDGGHFNGTAHWHHVRDGWVVGRCVQEGKPGFLNWRTARLTSKSKGI